MPIAMGDIVLRRNTAKAKGKWALPPNTQARVEGEGGWDSLKLRTLEGAVHYMKPFQLAKVMKPDPAWSAGQPKAKPKAKPNGLEFNAYVVKVARSGKACLVALDNQNPTAVTWLPCSQCEGLPAARGTTVKVKVPEWLVKEKGIAGLAIQEVAPAPAPAQAPAPAPVAQPIAQAPAKPAPEPVIEVFIPDDLPEVAAPVVAAPAFDGDLLDVLFD